MNYHDELLNAATLAAEANAASTNPGNGQKDLRALICRKRSRITQDGVMLLTQEGGYIALIRNKELQNYITNKAIDSVNLGGNVNTAADVKSTKAPKGGFISDSILFNVFLCVVAIPLLTLLIILLSLYFLKSSQLTQLNRQYHVQTKKRPAPPLVRPDPAIQMAERFHFYPDPNFPVLSNGSVNLQKLTGTLARLQNLSLRDPSNKNNFPRLIGINAEFQCQEKRTIGSYNTQCHSIRIDYSDGNVFFEEPVEMELTLAHEWGHHLVNITGTGMSRIENEVTSDCFAGVVFGYYAHNNLISTEEFESAVKLIIQIGNNSPSGVWPNSETRFISFVSAFSRFLSPGSQQAKMYDSYCSSLDRIIDINKIRYFGLVWPPT